MYTRIIKIEEATSGMILAESVYVATGSGTPPMLAADEGTILDIKLISLFKRRRVQTIKVVSETKAPETKENIIRPEPVLPPQEKPKPAPSPPLKPQPRTVLPPPSIKRDLPPEEIEPIKNVISEKLKEEAVDNVRQLFNCFTPQDGVFNRTTAYQCVTGLEKVVGDLLDVLSNDSTGLVHINDLKHFDEYTYHHSLSVSMLSMATGREPGLSSDELFRLGRCAMLHDVGKQLIPLDIINKKGELTEDEFKKVKNHAIMGAINLKNNSLGNIELWNGIMFHHEKVNGTGYPKGLMGKDIPLFSKIIAVADVYDAVTSYRAHRAPLLPSEAFELIRKDIGISFEYDVVKAFFAKLELYPINTIVELSDGRLGIVVDSDDIFRLRPVIRIWGGSEIVHLAAPINRGIDIVDVMNPQDLPSGG
ncbi:MAG: HD-GYP domain-containing protein [Defluviitaleaceae bacterium]|nr:HD-GYP domain-containing protein [Defluviitaleaceae bacterium]